LLAGCCGIQFAQYAKSIAPTLITARTVVSTLGSPRARRNQAAPIAARQ
jgi:hypothetical protein